MLQPGTCSMRTFAAVVNLTITYDRQKGWENEALLVPATQLGFITIFIRVSSFATPKQA
jgi:hypothetical protein